MSPHAPSNFVVRYRMPLYVALACWAVGWFVAALLILDPSDLMANAGSGHWVDAVIPYSLVGFLLLLGPCLAAIYAVRITFGANEVSVSRLFGINVRTYARPKIKTAVTLARARGTSHLVILFVDGRRVKIEQTAVNSDLAHSRLKEWALL